MAYMSKEGYEALVAELHRLEAVESPKASAAIAEARDKGDLSENAEYDAAKDSVLSMDRFLEKNSCIRSLRMSMRLLGTDGLNRLEGVTAVDMHSLAEFSTYSSSLISSMGRVISVKRPNGVLIQVQLLSLIWLSSPVHLKLFSCITSLLPGNSAIRDCTIGSSSSLVSMNLKLTSSIVRSMYRMVPSPCEQRM